MIVKFLETSYNDKKQQQPETLKASIYTHNK